MLYQVYYSAVRSGAVAVEADSPDQAKEHAEELWDDDPLSLDFDEPEFSADGAEGLE